jgi:hypothetical protein
MCLFFRYQSNYNTDISVFNLITLEFRLEHFNPARRGNEKSANISKMPPKGVNPGAQCKNWISRCLFVF